MKRTFAATAALAAVAFVGVGLAAADAQERPAPPTEAYIAPAEANLCADQDVTVYFGSHEAMLSSHAARAVSAAADGLAGCAVTEIRATVMSEDVDTDEAHAILADARANAVLSAFASQGIVSNDIRTDVVVRSDVGQTAAQVMPIARRVEVRLTAEPAYGL